jgi:hypothetical protein
LAPACLSQWGHAVYKARFLADQLGASLVYDDQASCQASLANKGSASEAAMAKRQEEKPMLSEMKEQEGLPDFGISPNPCADVLHVLLSLESQGAKIQICNLMGAVLLEQSIRDTNMLQSLNVHSLANGVYIVRILDNKLTSAGKKVIIQK